MKSENWIKEQRRARVKQRLGKIMKCLCSGEQLKVDEIVPSPASLATKDYAVGGCSPHAGETDQKPDTGNIEEAESSLRESGYLNYEVSFFIS